MSSSSLSLELSEWRDLNPESLVAAPCLIEQTLCQASTDEQQQQPRLAKDVPYARAILDAWKEDEEQATAWEAEWCHCRYSCDSNSNGDDTTPLYGHLIRRSRRSNSSDNNVAAPKGILFFHTAAGPHDLFLLWKAVALVHQLSNDDNNNNDVVVLLADVLSDDVGWAWEEDDRTRYDGERQRLREQPALMSARIRAATQTLHRVLETERTAVSLSSSPLQLAALGWCLGGQAILQLSQLRDPRVKALVTFHGVFDTVNLDLPNDDDKKKRDLDEQQQQQQVLICHGTDDPFVSAESLEAALEWFQQRSKTSLLQLSGARHGFTNPAQAYDAEAANKAWRQAVSLIRRAFREE